jgi:hypothetical protein
MGLQQLQTMQAGKAAEVEVVVEGVDVVSSTNKRR